MPRILALGPGGGTVVRHPMRMNRSPAILLALVLTGCGDEPAGDRPAVTPYRGAGETGPSAGNLYVAQEVWLTYDSPPHQQFPIRVARSKEDARRLAEALHARATKGDDVGLMAQEHSNAPGARAEGFSGVLPRDREHPDERDRALMSVREGEVTPIVDWRGGFWFAKRITTAAAKPLEALFDRLVEQGKAAQYRRVRARVIVLSHNEAFPARVEADRITPEMACAKGRAVVAAIRAGADFAEVAKNGIPDQPLSGSWDDSGAEGGVMRAQVDPLGKGSPWVMRYDTGYPDALLQLLFDPATPVGLHPEPLRTGRGVIVVELLERARLLTPQELEASRRR
jgi:hypothetical protein